MSEVEQQRTAGLADWVVALAQPESTRSGRRWLRRALIAAGTAVAVVAATVAGITYPWHSVGSPEKLLQAVNVALGSDGRIAAVTATNVHQTGKGASHDVARFGEGNAAQPLPVRVAVGYTLDGHHGHDLKEIVGKSGTIEVDVTVTNVTQTSQLVSYADAGGTHQVYQQVAAPMTVVGTATLPANSFSALQAPGSGATATGDATSGDVQTGSNGNTAVQWATVLAPPRLAPAATFRLVETTTNFQLPHFSIAAEPGLVTDPSAQQLLGRAFAGGTGTDASRLLDLEHRTVTMIGALQRQLADVAGQLAVVKDALAGAPGSLTRADTARLVSANSALRQQSAALFAAVGNLEKTLTATLGAADTGALEQLHVAETAIADYIGVGSVTDHVPGRPSPNCKATDLNRVTQPKTLLGRLAVATGQAQTALGAGTGCAGAISALLDTVIGPADAKSCAPTSNALVCDLTTTGTALDTLSEDVDAAQAQSLAHLDPTYQTTVANDIAKLTQAVTIAQGQADGLLPTSGPTSAKQLAAKLAQVQSRIRSAVGLLSSGQAGLEHDLKNVNATALADIATLGPGTGASSIADQINELDNRICNPPSDMNSGLDQDYVAVLNSLVSGGTCGGTLTRSASDALFGTPLAVRVASLRSTLTTVLSGSATLQDHFGPMRQRLSSIDSELGAIASDLGKHSVSTGTLSENLAKVVSDLDSLYDAKATAATCTSSTNASLPLNILTEDFKKLTCRADAGVADVKALLGSLKVARGGHGGSGSAHLTGSGSGFGPGAGQVAATPWTVDPRLRQGAAAFTASLRGAGTVQPAAAQHLRQLAAIVLNSLGPQGPQTPDSSALVQAQIRQGLKQAQSLPAFDEQLPAGSSHVVVYVFTLGSG